MTTLDKIPHEVPRLVCHPGLTVKGNEGDVYRALCTHSSPLDISYILVVYIVILIFLRLGKVLHVMAK